MIFEWIKSHKLICVWALASIVYAFIIHCLFSYYPDNQWFVAKWSAGEILTYVSTVSLGLLAVWQNQKIQEESDKSQERLEKIIADSNSIAVINKIIQYEMENLQRLRITFDDFSKASDPQRIASKYGENVFNTVGIMTAMSILENELDNSFFALGRELRIDFDLRKNDEAPLKKAFVSFYLGAKQLIQQLSASPNEHFEKEIITLMKLRDNFAKEREDYLVEQENKLNRLLYEKINVDEIKNIYKRV